MDVFVISFLNILLSGKFNNKVDIAGNEKAGVFDHGDTATNACLKNRFNSTDNQETLHFKNFNKGHMVVYRLQITCKCEQGKKCARVLPKREQGWTEYMGSLANGYFNERPTRRFNN